ncbi:hypothetical protein QAD02_007604 [Eretmocerus hayati]|uniref:Uncharacterized protein n=1 Tax=Eretmocerus hayati TaxID=131215 RepID=A0ACC2N449_9HYME|nr:hypothetical protein QAD02_007604 [Eretmocerus hayati]
MTSTRYKFFVVLFLDPKLTKKEVRRTVPVGDFKNYMGPDEQFNYVAHRAHGKDIVNKAAQIMAWGGTAKEAEESDAKKRESITTLNLSFIEDDIQERNPTPVAPRQDIEMKNTDSNSAVESSSEEEVPELTRSKKKQRSSRKSLSDTEDVSESPVKSKNNGEKKKKSTRKRRAMNKTREVTEADGFFLESVKARHSLKFDDDGELPLKGDVPFWQSKLIELVQNAPNKAAAIAKLKEHIEKRTVSDVLPQNKSLKSKDESIQKMKRKYSESVNANDDLIDGVVPFPDDGGDEEIPSPKETIEREHREEKDSEAPPRSKRIKKDKKREGTENSSESSDEGSHRSEKLGKRGRPQDKMKNKSYKKVSKRAEHAKRREREKNKLNMDYFSKAGKKSMAEAAKILTENNELRKIFSEFDTFVPGRGKPLCYAIGDALAADGATVRSTPSIKYHDSYEYGLYEQLNVLLYRNNTMQSVCSRVYISFF